MRCGVCGEAWGWLNRAGAGVSWTERTDSVHGASGGRFPDSSATHASSARKRGLGGPGASWEQLWRRVRVEEQRLGRIWLAPSELSTASNGGQGSRWGERGARARAEGAEATSVDEREQGGPWGAWERRRRPWRHGDGDGELGVGDDGEIAERPLDSFFYLPLGPFLLLLLLSNSSSISGI